MKKSFATALAVALLGAMTLGVVASSASAPRTPAKNIVQTAVAAGSFKTLVSLVKRAGLAGALSGPGPLTVFAPTDAAFAKVPKATLAALAKDKAKLKAVLLYHVVKGRFTAARVVKHRSLTTLEGGKLSIRTRDGKVYVNRARVIKANVVASNGLIHVINQVLVPAG
ncbi:MAG TPA: fasciclin domain-containing protein [Solirubrobacteraceae bacterium]